MCTTHNQPASAHCLSVHTVAHNPLTTRTTLPSSHTQSADERTAESYAALERKAALYDKLTAGGYTSDDEARYNVDFLYKEMAGDGGRDAAPDTMAHAAYTSTGW